MRRKSPFALHFSRPDRESGRHRHPSAESAPTDWRTDRAPVQWAALVFGFFFVTFGFAGFVPGMTLNVNGIEMGAGSDAMLLGIIQTSVLQNVIHVLYGLAGLALSRLPSTSLLYLRAGGILAAAIWIFGLLVDKQSMANSLPLNTVDTWLYFVLALGMIGLRFLSRRDEA